MENLYKKFVFPDDYVEYCNGQHPASGIPFEILYDGLKEREELGLVSCSKLGNLEIFKYTQTTVCDRKWDYFTLLARGLILCPDEKRIIAFCLPKFFNYGEMTDIQHNFNSFDFTAAEKVDGSMGIIFNYDSKWMVATCGSFISEQAQWAEKWLHKNVYVENMDVTNTYLAEIIYPENRIVVSYDFSGLVLLSVYDKFGLEYTTELLESEASYIGLRKANVYDFKDVNQILELAKTLDHNQEGFVIRFASGVRLKVKGDEYVRIHRLISRVTPIAVWEAMLCGDDLNRIKKDLPEELERDFDNIVDILKRRLGVFVEEVETMYENTLNMSDRDLGIYLQTRPEAFVGGEFPESKRYIFMMRKGKFHEALNGVDPNRRKKLFNVFKPKANVLDGYAPSSAVNRFSGSNLEG